MQFAHILSKEKYKLAQVNATRFATEKGIFFAVHKEIRETALTFKFSVVHEYDKSKTPEGKETSSEVVIMKNSKNLLLTQLSM